MPDLEPFEEKLAGQWPPSTWRDVTALVAVSGGADSVALLRGMVAVRQQGEGQIIVAHFNHGLRGNESDADEAFVVELCGRLDLAHEIGRMEQRACDEDSPPNASGDLRSASASEADARDWRYRFLRETAARVGARFVVTAHTADDQAETVLHRVLRGTGIAGLAGIRPYRQLIPGVALVRPMLNTRRTEVIQYLKAVGQEYREDSTNADLGFTRNRIRRELLPQIADVYNPNVVEALNRLGSMAGDVQALVDGLVGQLADRCIKKSLAEEVIIDCRPLHSANAFLVRHLLIRIWTDHTWPQQAMSYDKWDQLAKLATDEKPAKTGTKIVLPGNILAERTGDLLLLLATRSDDHTSLS
ncbi:MAG: tRNA lysidine(34) synthetase TilS [Planctomycetes bacterium]|nr:tRNA lysidine(34) synthetase TilS [Planctomycetota bacterium]MBL7042083.1 tRNA lysidine(34) synthetase TilS [Pirellulaceae bacterium]